MRKLTLFMLACCAVAASAQDVPVNREKYPDYVDPRKAYPAEPRLMKYVPVEGESQSRKAKRMEAASELPEYWNNADTKYFPPVFNQAGGSCGSASRIGYMFTHEINSLRDVSGKVPENQYPTHFVWLFTNGNDGKDQFVEFVGVPNAQVYGGQTYSSFFGYQEETYNDFGWMTGYDKWMNAISNRMLRPTSNPLTVDTEEGRLAAKAWLYNHAGDLDFKAGGLIGLGVASGGVWKDIPKTAANDAAGVTGMGYVHRWGTQVDHAVTMVGWDDRIEFDLDNNGKAGEPGKDEKGAWIIVNSWGDWENKGFIYCPYKYAGPVSNQTTGEMTGGYWSGELYHARKNFRPLRAIKLKMTYSHRSELLLQVGVSTNLNATEPDYITDMHHFRYGGDGNHGNTDPAPAIPMLGNWNGKINKAPMEFMYDLTDFSSAFDTNKPLKYFFVITRKKDKNAGTGKVLAASIVDLEHDLEGVESPFDLGGESFEITEEGKRLMISAIVYGAGYEPVTNLSLADGVLTWGEPLKNSYKVASYNVYRDGTLVGNTKELTYKVEGGQEYAVTAVYEDGTESAKVLCTAAVQQNSVSSSFENEGFVIPNVFANHYKECTIEFFINPSMMTNWNNAAGPGWGTYMHHFNSNGTFTVGWNTNARLTSTGKFNANAWSHIAIVVQNNKITLYKNGTQDTYVTSNQYSGLGGFGDLVFNYSASNSWQNAMYDEIRIWDHARTAQQIKGSTYTSFRRQEFYGDVMPQGLLAYYKGDTFEGEDGSFYMRDCVGGNHAKVYADVNPQTEATTALVKTPLKASLEIDPVSEVFAGLPVTLTATRGDGINKLWWNVPACGIADKHVLAPTVTFAETGTYEVVVSGSDYNDKTISDTIQVEVKQAPALDATFTLNSVSVPCGEHLSMYVNNYAESCVYEWSMPGANVETVYGAKAGATYNEVGEYTITLKITSADGRVAESSQKVQVTSIPPVADFYVSSPVVEKGKMIKLVSNSLYGATDFEWVLDGPAQKTTITPGNETQYWTPKYPGRYNVSLKATNAAGSNTNTKENALIVTNADSKNGLTFSHTSAKVSVPVTENLLGFVIEFWANPSHLANYCWGMGDNEKNLLIRVDASGSMIITINGTKFTSDKGFVQAGSWNHYAIRRALNGAIYLYRNGVQFQYRAVAVNKNAIKDMSTFTIGVDGMPMNGSIDEFRLWASNYSGIASTCNQPLENPESYAAGDNKLRVYYDFNQSGGNVIDRSGNGNDGVRSGFGPDGDAWGLSKGVFSLYLGEKQSDETITAIEEVGAGEPVTAGRKGVYTLSGQYVGNTIEGLPAGMYIVDGKKTPVK